MKQITLHEYKQRMLRVLLYIQQHLDDELPLAKLAALACFSPFHFHRVFRGMIGESVKSHVRRLRLERAAGQLKRSSISITMIALDAGYETHEAFTRAFKSVFGQTPSEFRSQSTPQVMTQAPSGVHFQSPGGLSDFQPLDTGGSTMKVEIKTMDSMRVAFIRHIGPYNECSTAWEKLCTQMGAQGLLGADTHFIGLCHDDPDVTPPDKIRYDACITVDEKFKPEGEIGVQTIPGGRYAVTTHLGPYERLNETYANLMGQWLPRNGEKMHHQPSLEFYLNDPEGTDPEDLITDIYIPLEN